MLIKHSAENLQAEHIICFISIFIDYFFVKILVLLRYLITRLQFHVS